MRSGWIEVGRTIAVAGSTNSCAVDWFVCEVRQSQATWSWFKISDSTFYISGDQRLYRVRLSPPSGDFWLIEMLQVRGGRHA